MEQFVHNNLLSLNPFWRTLSNNIISQNPTELEMNEFFDYYEARKTLEELDLWLHDTDDDTETQWECSTPDVKLYYPEPFIASPSFNHEEIWFIHILHYNYWLWFFLFL
jgi:hypothetical protein